MSSFDYKLYIGTAQACHRGFASFYFACTCIPSVCGGNPSGQMDKLRTNHKGVFELQVTSSIESFLSRVLHLLSLSLGLHFPVPIITDSIRTRSLLHPPDRPVARPLTRSLAHPHTNTRKHTQSRTSEPAPNIYTQIHTHTHARTHARARTHTHTSPQDLRFRATLRLSTVSCLPAPCPLAP